MEVINRNTPTLKSLGKNINDLYTEALAERSASGLEKNLPIKPELNEFINTGTCEYRDQTVSRSRKGLLKTIAADGVEHKRIEAGVRMTQDLYERGMSGVEIVENLTTRGFSTTDIMTFVGRADPDAPKENPVKNREFVERVLKKFELQKEIDRTPEKTLSKEKDLSLPAAELKRKKDMTLSI